MKMKGYAYFNFFSFKIYNNGNWFLVNYFFKLKIYKIAKTTLTLGNSFFWKICAIVFEKIVVFWIRQTSFLWKSFSVKVFQTSMRMFKKAKRVKAGKIKTKSKNCKISSWNLRAKIFKSSIGYPEVWEMACYLC